MVFQILFLVPNCSAVAFLASVEVVGRLHIARFEANKPLDYDIEDWGHPNMAFVIMGSMVAGPKTVIIGEYRVD